MDKQLIKVEMEIKVVKEILINNNSNNNIVVDLMDKHYKLQLRVIRTLHINNKLITTMIKTTTKVKIVIVRLYILQASLKVVEKVHLLRDLIIVIVVGSYSIVTLGKTLWKKRIRTYGLKMNQMQTNFKVLLTLRKF